MPAVRAHTRECGWTVINQGKKMRLSLGSVVLPTGPRQSVRLQIHALNYDLATFFKYIELHEALVDWSLTSLHYPRPRSSPSFGTGELPAQKRQPALDGLRGKRFGVGRMAALPPSTRRGTKQNSNRPARREPYRPRRLPASGQSPRRPRLTAPVTEAGSLNTQRRQRRWGRRHAQSCPMPPSRNP